MSELRDIRYFAERMLAAINVGNAEEQENTLYDLAKLAGVTNSLNPVRIFYAIIDIWNISTADFRTRQVGDDEARQTVFRIIGEIFGKYGIPDPGYEEDEL